MKLIFASNNIHKLTEMRAALGSTLTLVSLAEAGIHQEIPEPFDTLRENAREKAQTIHRLTRGENCFSEDTGLEVDALGGAPGVHSARYAGIPVSAEANVRKLLRSMQATDNRRARFVTVICLILREQEYYFEGRCEGHILSEVTGNSGFGYDPVFMPENSTKSFAQMTIREKNIFSHRRKAVEAMTTFLIQQSEAEIHGQN